MTADAPRETARVSAIYFYIATSHHSRTHKHHAHRPNSYFRRIFCCSLLISIIVVRTFSDMKQRIVRLARWNSATRYASNLLLFECEITVRRKWAERIHLEHCIHRQHTYPSIQVRCVQHTHTQRLERTFAFSMVLLWHSNFQRNNRFRSVQASIV